MSRCELCETQLIGGRCPSCVEEERERFRALQPDAFPANAFPPSGLCQGGLPVDLRRALLRGELEKAAELWDALLRSLRPLGKAGRAQVADCFEADARLRDALNRPDEAGRLRQRAQSMRKDPAALLRRSVPSVNEGSVHDRHVWLQRQAMDREHPDPQTLKRVLAELDKTQVQGERRRRFLSFGAGGLAGLWCATVTGLPMAFTVVLGVGLGWLWFRRA